MSFCLFDVSGISHVVERPLVQVVMTLLKIDAKIFGGKLDFLFVQKNLTELDVVDLCLCFLGRARLQVESA